MFPPNYTEIRLIYNIMQLKTVQLYTAYNYILQYDYCKCYLTPSLHCITTISFL